MAMIEIRDVSKWYGAFQVLKDCTTKVEKGEVVVVCGPSGSGKSTLIKVVNGLEAFQKAPSLQNWRRLQAYVVGLFRNQVRERRGFLEAVPGFQDLYVWRGSYDPRRGLVEEYADPSDLIV